MPFSGYSVIETAVDAPDHPQAVVRGDSVSPQFLSVSYRPAYTAFAYGMAFTKDSASGLIAAKLLRPLEGSALTTVPKSYSFAAT